MTSTSGTPAGSRKRRTREHVIADLSINHLERFVLRCGWTVQRTTHDYGIDLFMETYSIRGEPQAGLVLFQVKATDRIKLRNNGRDVAVRLDGRDVEAWRDEPMPIILVLYDARGDNAYWLHVQPYLAERGRLRIRRPPATTTVYLPCNQILNEAAVRQFAQFRDTVLSRIRRIVLN